MSKKDSSQNSKFDRGLNSKLRDQEDVSFSTSQNSSRPLKDNAPVKPLQMKVEMTHLIISEEARSRILDTIKYLSGEDFEAKRRSEYQEKRTNLSQQYWVDRGHLVIQGTTDYSMLKKKVMLPHEKVSVFALNRLQNYGFHQSHCAEALRITQGDVGKAFEMLMSHYMHVSLPDPEAVVPEEVIQERTEELESICGIFSDEICQEKIKNQLWIIHLDLPYLADNYKERTTDQSNQPVKSAPSKKNPKKICQYYLKGRCRFGIQCKMAHNQPTPVQPVTKSAVDEIQDQVLTKFDIEIRFPPGILPYPAQKRYVLESSPIIQRSIPSWKHRSSNSCCYPKEPALVAFSPQSNSMPSSPRLRLTYYLQNLCNKKAEEGYPCVYDLIDLFDSQREEILAIVNGRGPSACLLEPSVPLYPDVEGSMEQLELDDEIEITPNNERNDVKIAAAERKVLTDDDELLKLFQKKQSSPRYKVLLKSRKELPAYSMTEKILNAVGSSQVVVVSGATGCGKSTQVPQFILDSWLSQRGSGDPSHVEIVCTQPRRLSAIGVAERVAYERMETVGTSVGYQIRLESKITSKTRLTFCTTGILLRRLESDPTLKSVSHVIVDEVHERSEESDFLLLILKKLLPLRPDVRIILMSATLNAGLFCDYFDNVPVIDIPGRTFPVEQLFLEDAVEASGYVLEEYSQYCRKLNKTSLNMLENLEQDLAVADLQSTDMKVSDKIADFNLTIRQLVHRYNDYNKNTCKTIYLMDNERINYELIESVLTWIVEGDHNYPREGSILVFLPGFQEIREMYDLLSNNKLFNPKSGKFKLIPLHSSLSNEDQAEVFRKPREGVRKIVLSTNIAETSVTIDDCVFVVDSGRMKENRFDSNKNMASLETVWVSRANALQRKGRAGRVMPGVCIHLYTHHHFRFQLSAQPVPEIHRVPLEQILLRIKTLPSLAEFNLKNVLSQIIEPPDEGSVDGAIQRLTDIGALNKEEQLTALGRHLAALPVDVRVGKLLLYGAMFSCLDSVLTMAASLSQKSPFLTSFDRKEEVNEKKKKFTIANSDHFTILRAYNEWRKAALSSRNGGYIFANENCMSVRVLTTIGEIKGQFLDYLVDIGFVPQDCRCKYKRIKDDKILENTGPELNSNGDNYKLLAGLLSASLYPNIVEVLSPEKFYSQSSVGAVPKTLKAEELKFKTKSDGYVFLHPSSVNHTVSHFSSPYLVFQEKVKTSKVFIRDCTMVPVMPLVMFTGNELTVELINGTFTITLEKGWIRFIVTNNVVGELLQSMQVALQKLMDQKIKEPSLNLNTDPKGKKILSTITYLVTNG